MNLQHLCSAQCAEIYVDQANGWVFVDWAGELTLEAVQHTSLAIARCFLAHTYPRVLNSNAHVTHVSWDVAQWLGNDFLPALRLSGVEQLAWVVPAPLRARNRMLDAVSLFPHVAVNLFDDVESAVSWLLQTAPPLPETGCAMLGRSYADELKLRTRVEFLAQQLAAPALVQQGSLGAHF